MVAGLEDVMLSCEGGLLLSFIELEKCYYLGQGALKARPCPSYLKK